MRFFEFNQDKDLESALVNALMNMQGDADEKDQSSEISFDAVKSIMSNTGYPAFNYDVFKKLYDTGKVLKNVVADFNQEKIIIKTEKEAEDALPKVVALIDRVAKRNIIHKNKAANLKSAVAKSVNKIA